MSLDYLEGVFCGVVGTYFFYKALWVIMARRAAKNPVVKSLPVKVEDDSYLDYGHPLKPVPTLLEALPSPPDSHVWEVHTEDKVLEGGDTTVVMLCKLIDLTASEANRVVKTSPAVDLIFRTYYGEWGTKDGLNEPWATTYRKYSSYRRPDEVRDHLTASIVGWAENLVDEYKRRQMGGGEYAMKG